MLRNKLGNIVFLAVAILLLTAFTVNAQPPKKRGAGTPQTTTATKPSQASTLPSSTPTNKPTTAKKKTIVVLDFNDVSLTADSVKRPIGKQLAVLLTTEFARSGNFSVISQYDKEVAEERVKSQKSGRDQNYAAQVGKQLSANLVVFGNIIEYTITTKNSNNPLVKKAKHDAKVGFTLTLVDVNTGEVKDGVTIQYIASSQDSDFGLFDSSKVLTEDQRNSMLTEASKFGVAQAVCKLSGLVSTDLKTGSCDVEPKTEKPIKPKTETDSTGNVTQGTGTNCKTVQVRGNLVFNKKTKVVCDETTALQPGTAKPNNVLSQNVPRIATIDGAEVYVKNLPAGTKIGTKLIAYQVGKVLKDDATGEIIKQEEKTIGELEVVSIADGSYICKIVSGSGITSQTLIKIAK